MGRREGGREEASLEALFVPVDTREREGGVGTRVVASKVKKQKQK